jgi:DNA primase
MFRQPTEPDVRELLISSGIRFKDKGDYYSIFCPFHDNRRTPSAALYKDKWLFKCFGCNTVYSFQKLYEVLKGKPWVEHGEFSMIPTQVRYSITEEYRRIFEIESGRITSVYDNAKALSYCREREVSDDFMRFFNFQATDLCKFKKVDKDDRVSIWQDRLLIPITKGRLPYSLEGRDYTRRQIPKCLYPKRHTKDICFNQDNLDIGKPLIVCEGIMDIHKIWSLIDNNVTCTFGVSLSDAQKRYLKNAQHLILFIDDDSAGHESVNTFEKFMEYDFKVAVVPGKDPGAASEEQLRKALDNAMPWVEFLLEDVKLFEKSQRLSFSLS